MVLFSIRYIRNPFILIAQIHVMCINIALPCILVVHPMFSTIDIIKSEIKNKFYEKEIKPGK